MKKLRLVQTMCSHSSKAACVAFNLPDKIPPTRRKFFRTTSTSRIKHLSEQFFELYLSRLPSDGSADEAWMKGAIEFTQKSLGGVEKETPTKQVFDFSFVQKAVR